MTRLSVLFAAFAGAVATQAGVVERQYGSSGSSGTTTTVNVDVDIVVISESFGGSSGTMQINPPTMTPGMTHMITVGGPDLLAYTPPSISAAIGDIVIFTFMEQNHTVTQSAFDTPCVELPNGVSSGFRPNPNNTVSPAPTYEFQVMVDTPLWFYCQQKGHCGKGMVFSINPTATKTQADFQMMAIQQNGTSTTTTAISTTTTMASMMTTTMAAPPSVTSVVTGSDTSGSGECSCQCLCGVDSFPSGTGLNSFGGFSGQLPAIMAGPA